MSFEGFYEESGQVTTQEDGIARRAVQAVLERVTPALDNEMPFMVTETIVSGTNERVVRISHMTLDEPVYLRVTARTMNAREARALFPDDPELMPETNHNRKGNDSK